MDAGREREDSSMTIQVVVNSRWRKKRTDVKQMINDTRKIVQFEEKKKERS